MGGPYVFLLQYRGARYIYSPRNYLLDDLTTPFEQLSIAVNITEKVDHLWRMVSKGI